MVAFYLPEGRSFNIMDGDFMRSMNLGDCTIANGYLQVNYRGDNPEFTEEELRRIEEAGLTRADTNWYEIEPEPNKLQREILQNQVFQTAPSTTIIPSAECPNLKISFVHALSDEQMKKVQSIGLNIKKVTAPLIPIR